ncbi:DUF1648 domain-containing protein [Salimicrobium halophilum]|uniref:Uncharacterized membrane protein n=1 Tax=Salimicrobium halophilum TaxID=86666 RepID=A0A1G8SX50_9BACI|nr:DUF5808 domain-containing protein [Salimicrobium halophilum]SDJ33829.1 Uncharacterized membrane protein [Salimicrobium halophilum]
MEMVIISLILLPVYVSVIFIPYWTRKTESFGVSIPERVYNDERLKSMRKTYAFWMTMVSAVHFAVTFLLMSMVEVTDDAWGILFSLLLFIYIAVSFVLYYLIHRRMKVLKEKEQWMKERQRVTTDLSFREQKLTYSSWWFIIPFLIAIFTILFTIRMYPQMPEELPMQYGLNGEVTNVAEKSYRSALMLPMVQLYLTGIFFFVNTVIGRAKQQTSAENPEKSVQQQVIFRRRWSLFTILSSILLTLIFIVPPISFVYELPPMLMMIIPMAAAIGIVIGAIILSATTGQGGSRVSTVAGKDAEVVDRDDDRYWKLGQIYFNPNDPSIFLEKRFGVGWTVNFARPLAWVFLLGIIGIAVLLPVVFG